MTVMRQPRIRTLDFGLAQALTTTPGYKGWTVKDTSSSGTPTYLAQSVAGGAMRATLASTSEAEIVTIYTNDVLTIDPTQLLWARWVGCLVGGVDAVTQVAFGLATAQNDTLDSVAGNLWARLDGTASTSAIVLESDNGTTDVDDVATGLTLSTTPKEIFFDFDNGPANIRFVVDGQRVGTASTFSLSGVSLLQPFIQLQKASGTGVPYAQASYFEICYREEL